MVNDKLRVGIAGYGVVGQRRHLYVDKNPHMKTVAVSDVQYSADGVMSDGVKYFTDYRKLFDQELDILFVSLPNYLAAEATILGIQNSLHVFCEKPPGRNVDDIEKVIQCENLHPGVKLKYGFNHRYHYSVIDTKRIIESGQYGKVINLRGIYGKSSIIPFSGGWRSERKLAGGGILLDQGIHMLDMMLYFCGEFDEVKSFVSNGYWNHDVEDNAYAIMRSKEGCIAMLHSTATQWQHRFRLEITLQEALVELSGILSGSKSYGQETLVVIPRREGSSTGSFVDNRTAYLDDHSWRDEVNEFADIVISDKEVTNGSSHDALKVMSLVNNIYCADQKWEKTFGLDSRS